MGVIYKILSPTGRLYVGKTYDLRKRINCHKCASKKGSSIILHNSIAKYGWDTHKLEIIETVDDSRLNEREIFWISEMKTYCYDFPQGMNMTKGGDGQRTTWMHKIEQRATQSKRFTGIGNPFYGKKHTDETKKIISRKNYENNIRTGKTIPEWGAEKGREVVRRKIICYKNDGSLFKEYPSLSSAAKDLKMTHGSICDSLRYNTWAFGKYTFRYKTENNPTKIEVGEIKMKTEKRPIVLLSESLEIITEYPSAKEASDFWGIPKTTINRAAMYNWGIPIRTGHSFIYKDLYKILMQEAA